MERDKPMIEIVKDDYLLSMGFTLGFITKRARAMGSLGTRPRLFDKAKVDQYIKNLSDRPKKIKEAKVRQGIILMEELINRAKKRAQR